MDEKIRNAEHVLEFAFRELNDADDRLRKLNSGLSDYLAKPDLVGDGRNKVYEAQEQIDAAREKLHVAAKRVKIAHHTLDT